MKKWNISNQWRASYLLMALGALNPGLNANDDFGGDKRKQQFANDFLGVRELEEGAGGHGRIDEDIRRLGKQVETRIGRENTEALTNAVADKLRQNDPEYGKLIGLGSVVTVIGKGQFGTIIREEVHGENLDTVTRTKDIPYEGKGGWPSIGKDVGTDLDTLRQAVGRAASFYAGLITIHGAGFVHSDLKPQNVMLENGGDYPCRIINRNGLQKIGSRIREVSDNAAPEYMKWEEDSRVAVEVYKRAKDERRKTNLEIEILQDELDQLPDPLDSKRASMTERLERLEERKNSFEERFNGIREFEALTRANIVTAQPSYDIYTSASILPAILFGMEGVQWGFAKYDANMGRRESIESFRKKQWKNYDEGGFFINEFTRLNRMMRRQAGCGYPEPVLARLASIQERISDIDPAKRPSAIEIFEELQDMALADWEHGFYSIQ